MCDLCLDAEERHRARGLAWLARQELDKSDRLPGATEEILATNSTNLTRIKFSTASEEFTAA